MTALPAASGFVLGYPCSWSCSSVIMYPCSFLYSTDPTMERWGGGDKIHKTPQHVQRFFFLPIEYELKKKGTPYIACHCYGFFLLQ